LELKKKVTTVFPHDCKPQLDVSEEYNEEEVSQCHQRIGVIQWAVELGRVDICTEVSMMMAHCTIVGRVEISWGQCASG